MSQIKCTLKSTKKNLYCYYEITEKHLWYTNISPAFFYFRNFAFFMVIKIEFACMLFIKKIRFQTRKCIKINLNN